MTTPLILASTSVFRKALLEKLALTFSTDSPDIDESRQAGESPADLVARLSRNKAANIAEQHPDALVIGSDQVACIDEQILGKPGNFENASRQLQMASGKCVTFYTGLCLFNSADQTAQTEVDTFRVHFRQLDEAMIERYLLKEEPYHCAGSFKSEGYGISLFNKLEGDDPNALIGLPLIRLIKMLDNVGIAIP